MIKPTPSAKYIGSGLLLILIAVAITRIPSKTEEAAAGKGVVIERSPTLTVEAAIETFAPRLPTLGEALSDAFLIAGDAERLEAIQEILKGLSSENLGEALELIESAFSKTKENTAIYEALLSNWPRFAGYDAMTYATEKLDGDLRLDAGVAATRAWGLIDPQAAAESLQNLPETFGKDYLIYDFAHTFVSQDAEAALEWTRDLPGRLAKNTAQHATRAWLVKDELAATEWIAANIDFKVESVSLELAAVHWARKDLDQVDYLLEQLPDDLSKTTAMTAVLEWLADYEPEKVAEWMNRHEGSTALNPVMGQFALKIANVDYESALSWAEGITSADMRDYFVAEVIRIHEMPTETIE